MFPTGTVVTVASDAMWRSMTTTQFGQYDLIWVDGGTCGGTTASLFGTAQDTLGTWGPAVTGRVVLLTGDPDLHRNNDTPVLYRNAVNWLKGLGRTVDGGRTGLFFSWGCTTYTGSVFDVSRGAPETFTSVLGSGLSTRVFNPCEATLTAAAATHPVTSGFATFWDCPMHGAFASIPSGYVTLGVSGGSPSLIAREASVACIP